MKILRLPIALLPPAAVTIGSFDGVHLGHQEIIRRLTEHAAANNLVSVVMTFEPQPREFLNLATAPARLSSLNDKARRMAQLGVDYLLVLPFNQSLRSLSADGFVKDILVGKLNTQWLQVGDDFRFGADRLGNFEFLQNYSFDVTDLPSHCVGGQRVSSTQVRKALSHSNFDLAATLLGEPYTLCGRVVYGRQLGRTIGVPTANILLPHKNLPCEGVFVVTVQTESKQYSGVANLGAKPTVGDFRHWLEVNLFEFSGSLYGKRITVQLHHRLRGIETFDNLDALKTQIQHDIQAAKAWFI